MATIMERNDNDGGMERLFWMGEGGQSWTVQKDFRTPRVWHMNDFGRNAHEFPTASVMDYGAWAVLSITKSSTTYAAAENLVSLGSMSWSAGSGGQLKLGYYSGNGWTGEIGPVLMYNRTLSAAELLQNYRALRSLGIARNFKYKTLPVR